MKNQLDQLETKLNDAYKGAPALPKNVKDLIVTYLPYLALIGGLASLWSAYSIYHWANSVSKITTLANEYTAAFGIDPVDTTRWSVTLWISLGILVIMGLLYVLAFSPLKARKKSGWNLLFYALLLSVVNGIVGIFISNYGGGFGSFIAALVGFVIGAYFLFQIREFYSKDSTKNKASKTSQAKK